MKKRIISVMLALCMVLSFFAPVGVLAASDTVVFTAVDGTAGNMGENYTNVTDGKNSNGNFTKWCVQKHTPETYVVLRASLSSSTAVPVSVPLNSYTFITGNDTASHSGRNPKAWEVYGSNDYSESDKTGTWTSVHSVSNGEMPAANFTSKNFEVDSNTDYKYYKFVIKEIVSETSGDLFQLCGINLEEKNEYPVTVCGTQVTFRNASDVLGDGTVSYSGGVLTLNGATLNYTEGSVIKSTADLKIELKGENKINGTLLNGKMLNFSDNTTFFGDGKLDIESADINGVSAIGDVTYYAIYSGGDLNFENTEVNLTVGNITNTTIDEYLTCYGVYSPNDCNFVNSNVDVTTGDVSVKADKFFGYGICVTNVTFESGSLKATLGNVSNESGGVFISAVDSDGNFIVKSGTVEIATKDIVCSGDVYDYGVSCNSRIMVENGATLISKVGNAKSSMSYIRALLTFDSIAVHNATLLAVGNGENATPLESESIACTNANRIDYSVDGKAYATAIVPRGTKAVLPPKLSKSGHLFDGWYKDETCTQKYATENAVDSDFNLYAKWKTGNFALGNNAIANGDTTNAKWDYVYFGEYNNTPTKWRVLSKNGSSTTRSDGRVDTATYKDSENNAYTGGAMFMLSEDLLGTAPFDSNGTTSVWIESNLYNSISSYFTSATGEEKYILKTTKKTPTFVAVPYDFVSFDGYSCDSYGDNMEDNTLFLLSAREVATYLGKPDANHIAKNNNTPNIWWLRSSGFNLNEPCYITDVGSVYSSDLFSWSSYGIRPALNLASDKILFTTPAENGKNVNAGLTALTEYNGNEYKLTLLDSEREFALTDTTVKTVKGGAVEIGYKNAKTGDNEYISAIITDENGDVLYYGQVGKVTSKDGTGKVIFSLPDDFDSSKHTLKLFNEQINGDKKTDFASDFAEVSVTYTTAKTVNLGVSVLKGGQATNIYFGRYQQDSLGNEEPKEGKENVDWVKTRIATHNNMGGYYSKDPVKWRVLGISNGNALLLSDKNLDVMMHHYRNESVTWGTSTMRSWLNGYGASSNSNGSNYTNDSFIGSTFTEGEKVSIASTVIESTALSSESYDPDTNDKIFLLSVDEAKNTSYFKDNAARVGVNTEYVYGGGRNGVSGMYSEGSKDFWWLRSPGEYQSYAAYVAPRGGVDESGVDVNYNSIAVRPAFNLDLSSVLFTSPAEKGKNVNAGLTAPTEYNGNEYKLTLLDSEREFALTDTTVKTVKGGAVEIGYKNAKTGDNEYISAMYVDDNGDVLYYGQLEKVNSEGKAVLEIPSTFTEGEYKMYIFNEQINGDKKTDFASAFAELTLTVEKEKTVNLGNNAIANGDATNAKWDYVYFGEYNNTPTKWRVLSKNGSSTTRSDGTVDTATYKDSENNAYTGKAMFMLSEDLLGEASFDDDRSNIWEKSSIHNNISSYFTSATGEEKYILKTTKAAPEYNSYPYDNVEFVDTSNSEFWLPFGDNMVDDKLFLLSVREVETYLGKPDANHIAKYNNRSNCWWLRSAGRYDYSSCHVGANGTVWNIVSVSTGYGFHIRPALNLASDKILFTTPAEKGKNVNAGLTAPTEYSGNEYKLTLLDSEREFELTDTTVKTVKGGTVSVGYKNAKTGENEFISAMIFDGNGDILYYGQIQEAENTSGSVTINVPDSLAAGDYTVKIFNEQVNGDKKTDFASELKTATLKVRNSHKVTLNTNGADSCTALTSYFEGEGATLPIPTRKGYTFGGWFENRNLTGTKITAIGTTETQDKEFFAKWDPINYKITYNLNGGTASNPISYNIETATFSLTAPTKPGYRFTGWSGTGLSGNDNLTVEIKKGSTENRNYEAHYVDITAPTGTVTVGENSWNTFLNTITFGVFFKETQEVTITATDNSGANVKIEYLLSEKALTKTELDVKTFTEYTDKFNINPDNEYIIYAKLTDTTGNIAYINSNGVVLDSTAPIISGIENGKTYCSAQTVTVTEKYVDKVTVNGNPVTLDANGKFTLNSAEGTQTVVATDKAGNVSAQMTVTVNDGHEGGTATCKKQAECIHCGTPYGNVDKTNHTGGTEIKNDKDATCTEDGYTGDTYCKGCDTKLQDGKPITKLGHTDADKDHICDVETCKATISACSGGTATCKDKAVCGYCGKPYGNIDKTNHTGGTKIKNDKDVTCTEDGYTGDTYCKGCDAKLQDGKPITKLGHTDKNKDHICDVETCKATISACNGGTATCKDRAVCGYCGKPYGTTNPDNHTGKQHFELKNATATTLGNIEYWYCKDCDKCFSDADYKNVVAKESTYLYAVVFDTDGADDIATKTTVKWNDKVLDNVTAPTKAGWNFIGWKCGNKNVNPQTTYGELASSKTVASVEIEAQWQSKTSNTLILHGNGGLTSSSSDIYTMQTNASSINASKVPFEKQGYYFNAWNTEPDGKGDWYRKGETVNFTAVHNGENFELYAIWEANYYTIVFDSNGADGTMKNLSMRYDKKANLTENAFEKDGFEFVAWNTSADGKGTEYRNGQEVMNLTDVSKGNVTLYAQWKDVTAPTGTVTVGENSWNTFLNKITFGIFFNETQQVEIIATDNSGENVKIEYILSDKELTQEELATATFTEYSDKFNIDPNNEYVVYAKLGDNTGNVTYINSNGLVLDDVAPIISGIENGKTYCSAQTVSVSDKYDVTVTVDGEEVTLDENGEFTLSHADGTQTVVATDKAGNVSAEMIVTVNDGHETDSPATCTEKAVCKHCGLEYGEVDGNNHSVLKHNSEKLATVDAVGNIEYWHCEGCNKYFSDADCKNEMESVDKTYLYAVVFDTDGGSAVDGKFAVKWQDNLVDGITAPTKDGYEFSGWKCETADVTADTKYSDLAENTSTASVEITAQWTDVTAPTGEITIAANSWKTFLNDITFALFFNDTEEVTITATDNSGEDVKIEYLLSDKELTPEELATATFTDYADKFTVEPNNEYVIYAKFTDNTGNVTYINSNGIVLDNIVPVISGIENDKTYCSAQTVSVSDKYDVTVTVNGEEVTLDENGEFTLSHAEGTQTVVATDKAGNVSAEITVTVNDGHKTDTPATCTEKAVCKHCGLEYGEVNNNNHALEHNKANSATVTETGNTEYWRCKDCDNCFSDKDGKNVIDLNDTLIPKLPPEIIDGKGQSLVAGEKKKLAFRSNAGFDDFIRVEVDGKTVDEKNYTVKEGSTIVTLKADYVATLSVGEHTLGIVSESGTATTTFTVNAKVVKSDKTPKTGDNSHVAMWSALLFVSAGALVGTKTRGKKKKYSAK